MVRAMFRKNEESDNKFNNIINKICNVVYKEYNVGDVAIVNSNDLGCRMQNSDIDDVKSIDANDIINQSEECSFKRLGLNIDELNKDKFSNAREQSKCDIYKYQYTRNDIYEDDKNEEYSPNGYILAICVSGKAKFKIDGELFCFEKETCALFLDGNLKFLEILQESKFVYLQMSGPDIDMLFSCDNGKYFHKILSIANSVGFYKLLSKVFTEKWDVASVIQNSSLIYEAMLEFVKVDFDGGKSLSHEFTEYVEKNICSRIFISQVAKQLLVSESKLTKVIRKEMGVSPYSYILETKLKISERDLIEGRSTIAEIAARYGFDSCAAYVTAFKKKRKLSPSAFRDNWITNCMRLSMLKI